MDLRHNFPFSKKLSQDGPDSLDRHCDENRKPGIPEKTGPWLPPG